MSNSKKKHKHPADGLYYVTPELLEGDAYSCSLAREIIYQHAKVPTIASSDAWAKWQNRHDKILVTQALLLAIARKTDPVRWMNKYGFHAKGFPIPIARDDSSKSEIKAVMDGLLYRAQAEGLVPKNKTCKPKKK